MGIPCFFPLSFNYGDVFSEVCEKEHGKGCEGIGSWINEGKLCGGAAKACMPKPMHRETVREDSIAEKYAHACR